MMRGEEALAQIQQHNADIDRVRYEWMLGNIARFRLFFVGLVFALLAFSVQFAITPAKDLVLYLQASSWVLLLATGGLALRDAGGFVSRYTESVFEGLSPRWRIAMWALFSAALILLAVSRVISL